MSTGSYYNGCLLASFCPILETCKIVGERLKSVYKIIQILDLCNWPQPSQSRAHTLPYYGHFSNARIGHPKLTVLLLQPSKCLIHIPNFTHVLTKCEYLRIPL